MQRIFALRRFILIGILCALVFASSCSSQPTSVVQLPSPVPTITPTKIITYTPSPIPAPTHTLPVDRIRDCEAEFPNDFAGQASAYGILPGITTKKEVEDLLEHLPWNTDIFGLWFPPNEKHAERIYVDINKKSSLVERVYFEAVQTTLEDYLKQYGCPDLLLMDLGGPCDSMADAVEEEAIPWAAMIYPNNGLFLTIDPTKVTEYYMIVSLSEIPYVEYIAPLTGEGALKLFPYHEPVNWDQIAFVR